MHRSEWGPDGCVRRCFACVQKTVTGGVYEKLTDVDQYTGGTDTLHGCFAAPLVTRFPCGCLSSPDLRDVPS